MIAFTLPGIASSGEARSTSAGRVERAGSHALDAAAVGDDLMGRRTASATPRSLPRRDLELVMADGLGPDAEMHRADFIGLELHRSLRRSLQPLEPGGVRKSDGNGLRFVEIVRDDDGDADLVAAGQRRGQVDVDEERLKHADRRRRRRGSLRPRRASQTRQVVIESARSMSSRAGPGRR